VVITGAGVGTRGAGAGGARCTAGATALGAGAGAGLAAVFTAGLAAALIAVFGAVFGTALVVALVTVFGALFAAVLGTALDTVLGAGLGEGFLAVFAVLATDLATVFPVEPLAPFAATFTLVFAFAVANFNLPKRLAGMCDFDLRVPGFALIPGT